MKFFRQYPEDLYKKFLIKVCCLISLYYILSLIFFQRVFLCAVISVSLREVELVPVWILKFLKELLLAWLNHHVTGSHSFNCPASITSPIIKENMVKLLTAVGSEP